MAAEYLVASHCSPEPAAIMDEDKMQRAFNLFDKDGDGKISQQELSNVMTTLGKPTSAAELKAMIGGSVEGMFTDRGGAIDYATFKSIVVRAAPTLPPAPCSFPRSWG